MHAFAVAAAGAFGGALFNLFLDSYLAWRRKRVVNLVPGRNGVYRDPLPRKERVAVIAIGAFWGSIVIMGAILPFFY